MRDIYEVLRQKELQIQKLTKETEALRIAINVLESDQPTPISSSSLQAVSTPATNNNSETPFARTGSLPQFP